MLTSLLRRWLAPPIPVQNQRPICVPEWSEPMAEQHAAIWWKVKPYTATSVEGVVALCQSIAYLENHGIPGGIVECGVGKGGRVMAAALALLALESTQRQFYLFDLFAGTTALAEVKQAMMQTRYPWEKLIFVPGDMKATLPAHAPEQIGLLRLNTDQYESTYLAVKCLYPRLAAGGILIVDHYGALPRVKRAMDTYFSKRRIALEMRSIEDTGRLAIKYSAEPVMQLAA